MPLLRPDCVFFVGYVMISFMEMTLLTLLTTSWMMNVIDFLRKKSWLTWLFCVEESRTQGVTRKVGIQGFQTLKCLLEIFPQGIGSEHFKKASPHWNLSRDFEKPMTHISHVFFICEKGTWTNWTTNWITLRWLHDLFHWFRIHLRKPRNGGPQNDGPWNLGATPLA